MHGPLPDNLLIDAARRMKSPRARKRSQEHKALPMLEVEWCDRHHVCESRRNVRLPPDRRVFFDVLPQLRVRQGDYSEVPLYNKGDINDDPGSFLDSLHWKWLQYPEFSRSCTGSLASSRAELPLIPFQKSEVDFAMGDSSPSRSPCSARIKVSVSQKSTGRRATVESMVCGPEELTRFVRWCEAKHGHLVNTWRKLDADGNMILSRAEFIRGVVQMGYKEDAHKLWTTFHLDENDMLSFIKFVPDLAIDLARFKHWAEETFQSVGGAFRAFDTNRKGKLSYKEFLTACERFSMWQRLKDIVHTLFLMLDDGSNKDSRGEITEEELDFLVRWKCPPYLWTEPDYSAKKLFWKQLLSQYRDNSLVAWRKAVDADGNMKVPYADFYKACAKLLRSGALSKSSGFDPHRSGNSLELVNKVYTTFDPHRSGYINLRRWDYRSYELLMKFTLWARGECGKVSDFVMTFQPEAGAGVSLGAFRTATLSLGMNEDDSRFLYAGLSLAGGASFKASRISKEMLVFLDSWDPEKMQQDDKAWEKMVGSRFGVHQNHQAKRIQKVVGAMKKLTVPQNMQRQASSQSEDGSPHKKGGSGFLALLAKM